MEEPWKAGIRRPACPINCKSPRVFKHTVFPPVFGPVITKSRKFSPIWMEIGTTLSFGIKGCRASKSFNFFSFSKPGLTPSIFFPSFAFAKTKSKWERSSRFLSKTGRFGDSLRLRESNIFSTSSFSSEKSSLRLFSSCTMLKGSIKSVTPVLLSSWTMPWKAFLYSAFTGKTWRPFLRVITPSCSMERFSFKIRFSSSVIFPSIPFSFLRISESSLLASSKRRSSDSIERASSRLISSKESISSK